VTFHGVAFVPREVASHVWHLWMAVDARRNRTKWWQLRRKWGLWRDRRQAYRGLENVRAPGQPAAIGLAN
jgi:hypothetical protein